MIRILRPAGTDRTAGFTLIELLVVMTVLGVLAALAIPTFMKQRNRGYLATLKSDLRNAATSNEAFATANTGSYAPPGDEASLVGEGYHPSEGVTLTIVDDRMTGAGGGYCLEVTHAKLGPAQPLYLASSGPTAGTPTETACVAS